MKTILLLILFLPLAVFSQAIQRNSATTNTVATMPLNYALGQQFSDGANNLYYPNGNVLMVGASNISCYPNGSKLCQTNSLFYANGSILADSLGMIHGDGSLLINLNGAGMSVATATNAIGSTPLPLLPQPQQIVTVTNGGSQFFIPVGVSVGLGGTNLITTGTNTSGWYFGNGSGLTNVNSTSITNTVKNAQSSAQNIFVYAVPAGVTNLYEVGGFINTTAASVDTTQMKVLFTDENGVQQSDGMSAVLTGTGFNSVASQTIMVKGGTLITNQVTLPTSSGSVTYDAGAWIKQR